MGSRVGIITPWMWLPCRVKHEPRGIAQQMMRKARVSRGRTSAPTRCHGTPWDPAVPRSRDAPAKQLQCKEGDFFGDSWLQRSLLPSAGPGTRESGDSPAPTPGPGTPAGRDPAVPCHHMCAECARAQPGCHRLDKLVLFGIALQSKSLSGCPRSVLSYT